MQRCDLSVTLTDVFCAGSLEELLAPYLCENLHAKISAGLHLKITIIGNHSVVPFFFELLFD